MGTGSPQVTVRAATLAGGEKNQDRFAYGDGWAFVLDGASSFATTQPEHDGGWYAERLKDALAHELTSNPNDATVEIVTRAIRQASSAHDDPDTCPTSTIAMARWTDEAVEVYVLGDSTAALIGEAREEAVTDSSLAAIASEVRTEYRSRLAEGYGFDDRHRDLLQQLQSQQTAARNRPDGYWIAGAAGIAGQHGRMSQWPTSAVQGIALATDGASSAHRYGVTSSWQQLAEHEPARVLHDTHAAEAGDPQAIKWPRSKRHDDKTALMIRFQ